MVDVCCLVSLFDTDWMNTVSPSTSHGCTACMMFVVCVGVLVSHSPSVEDDSDQELSAPVLDAIRCSGGGGGEAFS